MTNLNRRLYELAAALGILLMSSAAWAATPMVACSTGMLFIADEEAESQPGSHELVFTITHVPGVVPLVTTTASVIRGTRSTTPSRLWTREP